MLGSRRLWWLLLLTFAVVAFLAFAYPMYVIRPFRAQGFPRTRAGVSGS